MEAVPYKSSYKIVDIRMFPVAIKCSEYLNTHSCDTIKEKVPNRLLNTHNFWNFFSELRFAAFMIITYFSPWLTLKQLLLLKIDVMRQVLFGLQTLYIPEK